jgi:sugar lactone lactonase YvrE
MRCAAFLRLVTIVAILCLAAGATAQHATAQQKMEPGKRASSRVTLGPDCRLDYVGAFQADGSFKGRSRLRLGEFVDTIAGQPEGQTPAASGPPGDNALPSKQRVVEDYAPGAHPVETVKGRPVLADVVDSITSFAEEHRAVMRGPQAVTTDSRGRLIVADTPAQAVHVLDARGKTSFRIQGGPERRLQDPVAVAVDSQDNIYVSDADRGMVLVYDQLGRFRHYIGKVKGEAFFDKPAGIAVDSRAGRIYVADSSRNAVAVLDLHGRPMASFGGHSPAAGGAKFSNPTSIVLAGQQLWVLDTLGGRVQAVDLQGKPLREIKVAENNAPAADHSGLAVDSTGDIYISNEMNGMVRVYSAAGRLLNSFGRPGSKIGEFSRPAGVWADGGDRIYVADSNNYRVQVFQFRAQGRSCR